MANLNDVANCFLKLDEANEGDGISNLKLQKLVYYAQGFYIAIHDKALFNDAHIEAWTHGPVSPPLYHQYKEFGSNPIPAPLNFDESTLKEDELDIIKEVFEVFGQFSAWKLRNMTHEEAPWLENESTASIITLDEVKRYFKTRLN